MSFQVLNWQGPLPDASEVREQLMSEGYGVFAYPNPWNYLSITYSTQEDQCLWLLDGSLKLISASQEQVIQEGERVFIPEGIDYHFQVLSETGSFHLLGRKVRRRLKSA